MLRTPPYKNPLLSAFGPALFGSLWLVLAWLALLALHFGSLWLVLAWLGPPLALLLAFPGWALLDGRGFSQLFPLRCPQKVHQDPSRVSRSVPGGS